jgi:hypothetical protein
MIQDRGEGFYKNDDGDLLHGQNYIMAGSYNLFASEKDNYQYPIHGWYWFENEQTAREFFNLPPLEIIEES